MVQFLLACISVGPHRLLFGAIYKPPKAAYPAVFLDELHSVLPSFDHVVVIGDMNIDMNKNSRSS